MNVGDVFRVHTTLTKPQPKTKIVIYVGKHAGVDLFVWFNTDPREKRPAQMSVTAQEAPGITHNCFLDCSRVTTFPARELSGAERQGCASAEFRKRVAQTVEEQATTLTGVQRTAIAAALRKQ
jgi:hypothetical protein